MIDSFGLPKYGIVESSWRTFYTEKVQIISKVRSSWIVSCAELFVMPTNMFHKKVSIQEPNKLESTPELMDPFFLMDEFMSSKTTDPSRVSPDKYKCAPPYQTVSQLVLQEYVVEVVVFTDYGQCP